MDQLDQKILPHIFKRLSIVDLCLLQRVNKHLHACLNNPDTWRSLCKIFYPNQWLYLEGREAQERDPSVTWKNLVLWNYWLEGTYETSRPAVQSTVPINAQRLVVQKGTYVLSTLVFSQGGGVADLPATSNLYIKTREGKPFLVLSDRNNPFQEVTLEVEITRLEPDGHSSLRLHGLVFEEASWAIKREYFTGNLNPAVEASHSSSPEQLAWFRRQRRYWQRRVERERAAQLQLQQLSTEKRQLYQLIINQLRSDGLFSPAAAIAEAMSIELSSLPPPSAQLQQMIKDAMSPRPVTTPASVPDSASPPKKIEYESKGLDLDIERPPRIHPNFVTRYVATHKNVVRCGRFSHDGKYLATGSTDTSVKLLDVVKMETSQLNKTEPGEDASQVRPVLRTYYDHNQAVNDLDFHPNVPLLLSCSRDCTIRFFECQSTAKKAIRNTKNIRSISIHPSGDFLLSGTDSPAIRIYDLNTLQCYVTAKPEDSHLGPINQVRWAADASVYVSASKDGNIKVWDGVTSRCVLTIPNAHSGYQVSCAMFSKNLKYILSGGQDSTVRLWDTSSGRPVMTYLGAQSANNRLQTVFVWNEDYIVSSDEATNTAVVWDSVTGEVLQRLAGHHNIVRGIAASPVEPSLVTCSDDYRARFWTSEALSAHLLTA